MEPVVNLARLHIRAGREQDGYELLLALNDAVTNGRTIDIDDITVPAKLTTAEADHQEVRQWLWRVVIADGTRALTTAGRWQEALSHLRNYRGVGERMLDGRQVAVLAAASSGDYSCSQQILADTTLGESWENAVTMCLTALCRPRRWKPRATDTGGLISAYAELDPRPGLSIFNTRLFLAILDASRQPGCSAIAAQAGALAERAADNQDGYAAREILEHDGCLSLLTEQQKRRLVATMEHSALGSRAMPAQFHAALLDALDFCDGLIAQELNRG